MKSKLSLLQDFFRFGKNLTYEIKGVQNLLNFLSLNFFTDITANYDMYPVWTKSHLQFHLANKNICHKFWSILCNWDFDAC